MSDFSSVLTKANGKMTSTKANEPVQEIIPDILRDTSTKKQYQRGRFLGKVALKQIFIFFKLCIWRNTSLQGGFAKCFELTDVSTGQIYAGKIVSKQLLTKPHQKDKMAQEISIHRSLKHEHIVAFHSFFEDSNYVYIVLELCKRRVSFQWFTVFLLL